MPIRHLGQEAGHGETDAGEPVDHLAPAAERWAVAMAGEFGIVGALRNEAVGFVLKPADSDPGQFPHSFSINQPSAWLGWRGSPRNDRSRTAHPGSRGEVPSDPNNILK